MKVVQINAVCGNGSTGKICLKISRLLTEKNIENYIIYSSGNSNYSFGIKFFSKYGLKLQALKARILGNWGFNSKSATKKMISKLKEINSDIVHLHNIHGHDCNLEMLFEYFKESKTKVFWTFHDCWAFTGYCTHFVTHSCEKWKTECVKCPQRKEYSWFFDRSKLLYNKKKKLFTDIDLTIITPSQWLADLVKQSFLKNCEIKVINNGIDLPVFKPTLSDFREKYNTNDKFLILGVASGWSNGKGLDIFIELSKKLDKEKFQVVLVGTNSEVDKLLPKNIISIHRTENQAQLAELYTAADVFVNPTRADTFPTVNIETIACGTPVLTFKTGGSPEIIDEKTGIVVECNDYEGIENAIIKLSEKNFSSKDCVERAKKYDSKDKFQEYIDLYNNLGEI